MKRIWMQQSELTVCTMKNGIMLFLYIREDQLLIDERGLWNEYSIVYEEKIDGNDIFTIQSREY